MVGLVHLRCRYSVDGPNDAVYSGIPVIAQQRASASRQHPNAGTDKYTGTANQYARATTYYDARTGRHRYAAAA